MASPSFDPARRLLLRGRPFAPPPLRPPWALPDAFDEGCTRCMACASACPEGVIRPDGDGLPFVDFAAGECIFCRRCAEACPEAIFAPAESAPWTATAGIGDSCLALGGTYCQSCRDACAPAAIRFAPALRAAPRPSVDASACTGCGACVSVCPAEAIRVRPSPGVAAHG